MIKELLNAEYFIPLTIEEIEGLQDADPVGKALYKAHTNNDFSLFYEMLEKNIELYNHKCSQDKKITIHR